MIFIILVFNLSLIYLIKGLISTVTGFTILVVLLFVSYISLIYSILSG